jgi:RNA polymerase sigma factor (sigma-70 family)
LSLRAGALEYNANTLNGRTDGGEDPLGGIMDAPSAELMALWRGGDQQAAEILFRRYVGRLLALARSQMSAWLARHIDAEDAVQSAYRSFFDGALAGRYVLRRNGDLWRLLSAITVHKVQHQVERHTAGKRSVALERHFGGESSLFELQGQMLAREPTPEQAAALADTLEEVFRGLEPLERRMVELRLQGFGLDEIAADVRRSERTVRRLLERVKERLQQEYPERLGL